VIANPLPASNRKDTNIKLAETTPKT
jgi:hypothetical protein